MTHKYVIVYKFRSSGRVVYFRGEISRPRETCWTDHLHEARMFPSIGEAVSFMVADQVRFNGCHWQFASDGDIHAARLGENAV